MAKPKIGELLKDKGLLNDVQLKMAMHQQRITGDLLGDALIKLGFVTSKEAAQTLAEQAEIEFIDLSKHVISEDALRLVPRETAEKVGFLPLAYENDILTIGIDNPSNVAAIDTAIKICGKPPKVYIVDTESFYDALERSYYFLENPIQHRIENTINEIKTSETLLPTVTSTLTELFTMDGIRREATDIHINPTMDSVHVFYRIDGVLHHAHCFPKKAQGGVISRVKILSHLDISEQRLPQDGSFTFSFLKKKYDMRVSTIPAIYGENLVIRILGASGPLLRVANLGFDELYTKRLRTLFSKPYGIILLTGPTGSGKTTTLYAALRELNLLEKNILTVEDPVEYRFSLIRQTEVNERAGYDFPTAGRNFMRQDPDVMLLGEIRDEETAKIAIRASITGHLVLTTLHTNDAVTAIPRLLDLDVDRFLLSSSLLAIIAQRLIRKICSNCKVEYPVNPEELHAMGMDDIADKIKTAFKGSGCPVCNHTGYHGRTAIGELLFVDDEIKELIYSGASISTIKDSAINRGMKLMKDYGMEKVFKGITTIEEILRTVG